MKAIITFIAVLGALTQARADLELQSVRCSSKDLTLDMAVAVDNGLIAEAKIPNAKGVLLFQARTQKGLSLLGKSSLALATPLASELIHRNPFLIAYVNGKLAADVLLKEDVRSDLSLNKPLIYHYEGSPEGLVGSVSYIGGKKIVWASCAMDFSNPYDIKGYQRFQQFPDRELLRSLQCPREMSALETNLILDKGPLVLSEGRMDVCLNKVINRTLAFRGKTTRTVTKTELENVVSSLMSSAWRGQIWESENGAGR